jgi:predicted P-loop ATPase
MKAQPVDIFADEERANPEWRENLIPNKDGNPKPILANALTALRECPAWSGVLAFNEFSLGTVALKLPPWPGADIGMEWNDQHDRLATNWLQQQGIFVGLEVAGQAIQTAARDRPFHPVREYLDSLTWDKEERLDIWLNRCLGVEQTPYTAAVGSRWLISAVARIYRPGEKADCCLILEGPQGILKSTALKTIAGDWFTDEIEDLGSKDAAMQVHGVWIIELAELDSISRGEVSRIKAFMSRATDRFRPPYGKRVIEAPRQCVFAGSVNKPDYLRDETGGRRFWPVKCTSIDITKIAEHRDQILAEAVFRFRKGEKWWLDSADLNEAAGTEQASRFEEDAWTDLIRAWLLNPKERLDGQGHPLGPFASTPESVTMRDVLTHAIGKREDLWTPQDSSRVSRCLRYLGYERRRIGPRNDRQWRYELDGK